MERIQLNDRFLIASLFWMLIGIASKSIAAATLSADSLASRLMYQVWSFPQEKVYVMTDRDAYTSGDTVRFRAWLVDAATHARPQQPSRFVYVELRNPFGDVEKRVKIRSEERKFAGIIALDEEMAEGNYTLCAYTQFMQNSGKDYFFRKSLPVFSQLSKKYRLATEASDGNLRCTLFDKMSGREVRAEHVSVMGSDGNYLTQNVRKRSSYTMGISRKMAESGVVKVKFDRYEKYVVIPYDTAAVSVTFHPEGGWLVQLLLADSGGNTLSSRMLFNHSGYIYGESVETLPAGDYAVRAFRNLRPDSTTSIVSDLLLQSELKGHIEDPDYYFRERGGKADADLDLLLLTQGWERYDVPSAFKGDFAEAEIPLELGGSITGTVKSRWRGKPLDDAIVMLLAPQMEHAAQAFTDSDGRFEFSGFDWPEDTSFIIQVFGKSGSKELNYDVDRDEFPASDAIASRADETVRAGLIDESMLTAGTIMLEELEVTAPMTLEESRREMLSALGVRSFTAKDIEEMRATTYEAD